MLSVSVSKVLDECDETSRDAIVFGEPYYIYTNESFETIDQINTCEHTNSPSRELHSKSILAQNVIVQSRPKVSESPQELGQFDIFITSLNFVIRTYFMIQ